MENEKCQQDTATTLEKKQYKNTLPSSHQLEFEAL